MIYYILVYAYYQQTINPNHSACLINTYGGDERSHHRNALTGCIEAGYTRVARRDNGISPRNDDILTRNTSRLEHAHSLLSPRRRTPQIPKSLRGVGASSHQNSNNVRATVIGVKQLPFVSRSLKRDHRPPPLIQSPSPIGLSPGPPSYGPSRVYAAFAAPVLSTECDKSLW